MRQVAGQPFVLWTLALFFLGLGFTARFDVPLAVLAVGAALAFSADERQSSPAKLWQEHWSLVLFLLVAAVATLFSGNPRHSLGVQPQLLPALLCYAVIVSFVRSRASISFICAALLCSGLLTAALMLVATFAGQRADDPLAQVQTLGNALLIVPNDVLILSVIAPLVLGMAWTRVGWWRFIAAIYLLSALVVSAMIQSRQAVILLILGSVAVVTLMRPRWSVPILIVGILTVLAVDGLLGWPLAHKIFMFPRAYVWHTAWVMFLDRPWIGQGPGMFKDLYYEFLERAGYVLAELDDRRTMPWAHSLYLEQLAERGIPGLLGLLSLMGTAIYRTGGVWAQATSNSVRSLAAGVLSSLIVLAAAGIAEATLTRLWVTVLLLVLVALSLSLSSCRLCDASHTNSTDGS